ncbi:ALP1-like protein [Tanacetum coccineum]
MSDSSFSDSSDLDDIAEYEMIMEINNEDQDEVEAVRMRRYINRERDVAEERLMADYFGPHPKYPAEYFRRRYRMNRELFLEIVQGIENYIQTVNPLPKHFQFFTIRYDCTGLKSFSVIMKCTSAIRQLAYGTTPDALDEYLQMGAHCARDCLDYFCMCVMDLYQPEFLRKPTLADIQNLYAAHNRIHGFPGMLGSIDCMHWEWVNCPKSWHGQYGRGDKKYPTIILEAVASYDLWIWHAFFGVAGANNDITVLHHSPLFDDLLADNEPVAPYVVNGQPFDKGYYLADATRVHGDIQDVDHPVATKSRLPCEVKQKLEIVARLAHSSQGRISDEIILRHTSILWHWLKPRALKELQGNMAVQLFDMCHWMPHDYVLDSTSIDFADVGAALAAANAASSGHTMKSC